MVRISDLRLAGGLLLPEGHGCGTNRRRAEADGIGEGVRGGVGTRPRHRVAAEPPPQEVVHVPAVLFAGLMALLHAPSIAPSFVGCGINGCYGKVDSSSLYTSRTIPSNNKSRVQRAPVQSTSGTCVVCCMFVFNLHNYKCINPDLRLYTYRIQHAVEIHLSQIESVELMASPCTQTHRYH